ncbi:MAG TPA: tetratricopeptide repeat protein, partial [Pyrinomonadaceae bacterium]
MRWARSIRRRLFKAGSIRTAIVMLAISGVALACSWSLFTEHSVRFTADQYGRGFYRLPPLPVMYDPQTKKEITTAEIDAESAYEEPTPTPDPVAELADDPEKLAEDAHDLLEKHDLAKAPPLLGRYLESSQYERFADHQSNGRDPMTRSMAHDLLDLPSGSSVPSVDAYIDARLAANDAKFDEADKLIADHPGAALADNWEYLKGVVLYLRDDTDGAKAVFNAFPAKFPSSKKRESALYMLGRISAEKTDVDFSCIPTSLDHNYEEYANKQIVEKFVDAEKCQDETWHQAMQAFQTFLERFPNGRYKNDAKGWIAYLHRTGGEVPEALAGYYRLLGDPTDRVARLEAKKSLQIMGHAWDDQVMDRVEELISSDVNASMAYAYHRIYNHAVDLTYQERQYWSGHYDEDEEERQRVATTNEAGRHELARVVRFSQAMLKRFPQAGVSGGFLLRLAEAQLELQQNAEARKTVSQALTKKLTNELRAEALWVRGSAEHASHDLAAARASFTQLINEFPDSKLKEGAQRLLAITAEDQNDLETALEQYLDMHYDLDVDYYVDVLLPTDRLAKFVNSHKQHPRYNDLLYALGVRLMRDGRLDEARETFRRVVTVPGRLPDSSDYSGEKSRKSFAKDPDWRSRPDGHEIKDIWVRRDLQTISELERLQQNITSAATDDAKAEATYQLGAYQFDSDCLL